MKYNFFLRAIGVQARSAVTRCEELFTLWSSLRGRFEDTKRNSKAIKLVDVLFERPALTSRNVEEVLGVTFPTAQIVIDKLVKEGILHEVTGMTRNRVYLARPVIDVMIKDDVSTPDS